MEAATCKWSVYVQYAVRDILILQQGDGSELSPLEGLTSRPFELIYVEGEFEGGPELQAHVFHHYVATQQQERFAINLMFSEKVSMWGQHWVDISDILHDVLHCPQVGVQATWPRALPETACGVVTMQQLGGRPRALSLYRRVWGERALL